MKKLTLPLLTFALLLANSPLHAQEEQPRATPAEARMQSFQQRQALAENSIVNGVEFTSIGPSVFSGRVVDLDVSPQDPSHFYVAYASGGLWKTENNGITFTPVFDQEMVMTIGDIAVDWARNTIWIGSGEVNSSRSSYAGTGVFRSTDGGKTWQNLGLGESHHIGRILLHPSNPNIAWVAVLGHLYSPNQERGVYKTTDGGKSWQQTLFVNENAGAVDLILDPANPNTLYASTWERSRRAWNFVESGQGSGIYKSTDGGKSWKLLTTASSGFPTGEGVGRIGLTIGRFKGKTVLYASLDNYNRRPKEETTEEEVLTKEELRGMSAEDFVQLDKDKLQDFLTANRFPREYNAESVRKMVEKAEIKPAALVEYLEDANSLLFDTDVIGLEIYRSDNEGRSWSKTHEGYLDGVYYTYGYYFGTILVSPQDENKLYMLGVPVIRSDDGGKTFQSIDGDNVHSDHHAIWANPNRPGHLILGNDGGVNISYDDGANWNKCNAPAVGQFYYIAVDMADPYHVYGGLQDNGVWKGPSNYRAGSGWQASGHYPYEDIYGGDGMQVAVDTRDNVTVYTGLQFGNYARLNLSTGDRKSITPRHKLGERPYRWRWQTPIHLSKHNQDIFYMASNFVHRSFDQGDNFEIISPDLTRGGRAGDVPYGAISALHESPLKFGLIYAGSDDGLLHVSKDAGANWNRISDKLPQNLFVSRVQASQHVEGRVYVVLNGYRWDNFTPYLFESEDYGATWTALGQDLPLEPLNVVKEDPTNPDILYAGSDHGLYVSLDRGRSFMRMNNGLPAVAVHDVVIHPREKDIIVGTHGRSLYKASALELQQLNADVLAQTLKVFQIPETRFSSSWGRQRATWAEAFEPAIKIPVYTKDGGPVSISVQNADGLVLQRFETTCRKGLNYFSYDFSIDEKISTEYEKTLNEKKKKEEKKVVVKAADNGKIYLMPGEYVVKVNRNGTEAEGKLKVSEGGGRR